jgi:hypothetical protein
MQAMHKLCITCHEKSVTESPEQYPATLQQCDNCHDADWARQIHLLAPSESRQGTETGSSQP